MNVSKNVKTEEFDAQEEILIQMEQQTQLLKSINAKATFFIILTIASIVLSWLLS